MADSRRIVLVGPMYPYRGGIAHLSETMAACLLERGHTVHAITFTRQYPALLFPGRTQYETGTIAERAVEAERLIDTINPFSWWRTARRIQELGAEAVIFRYWVPFFAPVFGTIARILARKNIQSLVVVDNALPHERRPGDVVLGRIFSGQCEGAWQCLRQWIETLISWGLVAHVPSRHTRYMIASESAQTVRRHVKKWDWPRIYR